MLFSVSWKFAIANIAKVIAVPPTAKPIFFKALTKPPFKGSFIDFNSEEESALCWFGCVKALCVPASFLLYSGLSLIRLFLSVGFSLKSLSIIRFINKLFDIFYTFSFRFYN